MHHTEHAHLEPLDAAKLNLTPPSDMKKTTIMLVEDNPDYREAVSLALEDEAWIEDVRIFGAAEVALRALQVNDNEFSPGIILLDISLPGLSGVEAIQAFQTHCPGVKIIMLTQSDREADVVDAIRRGAAGYLLKSSSMDQLIEGIQSVMEGGAPLDPGVTRHVMHAISGKAGEDADEFHLAKRELEVLRLLSQGMLKKQIANELKISENTVRAHTKQIYRKLGVNNSPAAIDKAHRAGIL
jgi:DNA-binding NarL/FixJ family response regulator